MSLAAPPTVIYRPWGQVIDGESPTPPEELVMMAWCHYGTVRSDFMECLVKLMLHERDNGRHLDSTTNANGAYIHQLRNELVLTFLTKRKAHWLLMVDNDMTFAPDTLTQMLAIADPVETPILAALYLTPLHRWTGYEKLEMLPCWGHKTEDQEYAVMDTVDFREKTIELQWCGMGCTLIHRSVLEAVGEAHEGDPYPWFAFDQREVNGKLQGCGEDVTFCARAADLGFKTYGTPQVTCGHVKSSVVHPISYAAERTNPLRRGI